MKEYRAKLVWKIISLGIAPIFVGGLFFMFYDSLFKESFNWSYFIFTFLFAFGVGSWIIYGVIEIFKSKLVITDNEFIKTDVFEIKKLKFREIKGYTQDNNYLYLAPKSSSKKVIKISQYMTNKNEWKELIKKEFRDLELDDRIKRIKSVNSDKTYGKAQKQRDLNLKSSKKLSLIINVISVIIAVWFFGVSSEYYSYLLIVSVSLPFIALLVIFLSKEKIKAITERESPYPSLSIALIMTPSVIVLRSFLDFNILIYSNVWIITLISTIAFFYLFIRVIKSELGDSSRNAKLIIIYPFFIMMIGLFMFSSTILINCFFDYSSSTQYTALVVKKRISDGKYAKRYILTIIDPTTNDEQKEIKTSVSFRKFNKAQKGKVVKVNIKKGLFEIPWLVI